MVQDELGRAPREEEMPEEEVQPQLQEEVIQKVDERQWWRADDGTGDGP